MDKHLGVNTGGQQTINQLTAIFGIDLLDEVSLIGVVQIINQRTDIVELALVKPVDNLADRFRVKPVLIALASLFRLLDGLRPGCFCIEFGHDAVSFPVAGDAATI